MSQGFRWLSTVLLLSMLLAACSTAAPAAQPAAAPTAAAPAEAAPAATEAPTEAAVAEEAAPAATGGAVFFSTQFVPVEEQEKFRAILKEGGFDFTGTEEGPLLDVVQAGAQAGKSEIDVIGALHGTFPPLASKDALVNMIDIADDLAADRELTPAYLETGLLGSEDFLYYVPWMQATYIMAANKEALPYLPEGADVNALTWEQLGEWCKNIAEQTGSPRCGLPHAGLFHRFLEGYMWPSWTGGMVTNFKSEDAAAMLTWVKESLWPYVHPQSISYEFMQEPLPV